MSTFLELILSNAIATSILAIVVASICCFVRRPIVRNVLWLMVLLRLFMPPIWSIPLVGETASTQEAISTPEKYPIQELDPIGDDLYQPYLDFDNPIESTPETNSTDRIEEAPEIILPQVSNDLPLLFFTLWMVGSFGVGILALVRIRRFQRCLRNGIVAPRWIQTRVDELASKWRLRDKPEVWIVPGRLPPLVWAPLGFLTKSKIFLPERLLPRLSAIQLDSILAHELSHLRRRDPWIRLLELLSILIYWWHPMLGWIRRQLRDAEEQCCDAYVVEYFGDRKTYATALVETVSFLDESASPALLVSGAAPIQHLQRRISMIMCHSGRNRLTRWGLFAALLFAFVSLGVGPSFTQAQSDRRDPPRKEKDGPPPREKIDDEEFERKELRRKERDFPPEPKSKTVFDRPKVNQEELEQARRQLEEARRTFERAMRAMREAEERLAQMEGRREEERRDFRRNPDRVIPPERVREEPRPINPPKERRPDPQPREGGDRLENLERQLQRLAQELEAMRREMRRPEPRPNNIRGLPKKENRDEPEDR